jgi:hypothetical protein
MMVTIAWNPLGFHLFDALPKGNTLNINYYRVNILTKLLSLRPQVDARRFVIHVDNPSPDTARKCRAFCEASRLRLAVHQPYSPDLTPSDFLLFGHIKYCVHEIASSSREEVLAVIRKIARAIWRPTLGDVFRHWMERLELMSQSNGNCYP